MSLEFVATGGTRCCIHTPTQPLTPDDMTPELVEEAMQGAALVFFDGRLADAALVLADAAGRRGIPILVGTTII